MKVAPVDPLVAHLVDGPARQAPLEVGRMTMTQAIRSGLILVRQTGRGIGTVELSDELFSDSPFLVSIKPSHAFSRSVPSQQRIVQTLAMATGLLTRCLGNPSTAIQYFRDPRTGRKVRS